jgi:hypothetical protein
MKNMVIELSQNLFNDRDFRTLNLFVQLCLHKDVSGLYADLLSVKDKESFKRLDFDDREILTQNYNSFMQNQNFQSKQKSVLDVDYLVKTDPNHDTTSTVEFNLDEAIIFFNQSVSIVLENSLNDAYLMQAIIYHYEDTNKLKRHLENRWIIFENLGGCTNLENFINSKLSSFKTLPKAPFHYLRCFVLLDSDRISPLKRKEHKHAHRIHFLRRNRIAHHVLEKRNMENYMPIEVFKEWKDGKLDSWIDAYEHLSEKQKDYFNIHVGFSKKDEKGASIHKREELEEEIQDLYADISESKYQALDKGFKLEAFKRDFPKKFTESLNVSKKTLSIRTIEQENPTEFLEILQKINDLL